MQVPPPWLELRLADGAWIAVRPFDSDLEYYLLRPVGAVAQKREIEPAFLARWGAYTRVGRLAMEALERFVDQVEAEPQTAALLQEPASEWAPEAEQPFEVVALGAAMPDIGRTLDQYAESCGLPRDGGALNISGSFA